MKKIGIVTLNGHYNIGNRLQNYALKETLSSFDAKVETIWFISFIQRCKDILKKIGYYLFRYQKRINFIEFSKEFLEIKYYLSDNIYSKYDLFVAGSDQVWNYEFPAFNEKLLLSFSSIEKNISYAASFGVSEVAEDKKKLFQEKLKNFKDISVREEAGQQIIKELLPDKEVSVVLDPTMLLDGEKWSEIERKPSNLTNDNYIFTYFLSPASCVAKNAIVKYAKKMNYEVIDILDKSSKYYDCGPKEFIYLEHHAKMICTDSFHSSVFAILFQRPFVVFERIEKNRKSMNSRIETLLKTFSLNNRIFDGKEITSENINIDYNNTDKILESERKKSLDFLKKALDIKDED